MSTQPDSYRASPDISAQEFQDCLEALGQQLPFEVMEELGGGRSGARSLSVNVLPANAHGLQGHYVLKLCASQYARREKENHQLVERDPLISPHVPHLALALDLETRPFAGMFYQVAGKSLLTMTTLQNCLAYRLYPANIVQAIASAMLEWSVPRQGAAGRTSALDVLDVVRQGMGEHRLLTLQERLQGVVDNLDYVRVEGEPLGARWKINPLPYLLDRQARLGKEREYPILQGNLHGDLHPANVIIPKKDQELGWDEVYFALIDFAMARRGNALFDLAYFELSLLLHHFEGATPENRRDWWRLEQYLSSGLRSPIRDFVGLMGGRIADPIRRALAGRAQADRLQDVYWVSYLAASVEAGLNFARKLHREPLRQRVAFLTAVSRFHRLLEALEVMPGPVYGPLAVMNWTALSPSDPLRAPEPSKDQATLANPFYTGGRINDPRQFFGRRRLVREIRAELKKRCNVSLVGASQIGKSSLLYYLYATRADWLLDPGVTLEYVDLQGILDESDFCETILEKLGREGDTLRDLKRALSDCAVILLLDEMERLAEQDFSPRLHDLLRSLAQEPHFAMCLATQCPLVEVFPARAPGGVSPFHNIFTTKTLGPFSETEARDFLAARLAGTGVTFDDEEIQTLLSTSRCHPAQLQCEAKSLFAEKSS
jgi:hypothetical protein